MSYIQVQKTRPMNSSELTELMKRRVQAAQNKPAVFVQSSSEVTERIRKEAAQTLAITRTNGKYNPYNTRSSESVTEVVAGRTYAAATRNAQVKVNQPACCEPLPNIPVQRDIMCSKPFPGSRNIVRCYVPPNVEGTQTVACRQLLPQTIEK